MAGGRRGWSVIVTCEHGGNRLPEWLAGRFAGAHDILESHRGWDPGAMGIAKNLCASLGFTRAIASSTHLEARTSRLVVDLNRSEDSPTLFSEFTRDLPPNHRERILTDHYRPYRERIEQWVRADADRGVRVAHLSVHTFTPVLGAERREFDAGILFDPAREPEASLARAWIAALTDGDPRIDVRANHPYAGTDDGLTTTLRGLFPADRYVGIEVEVRNDLACDEEDQARWALRLASTIVPLLAV